MLKAGGEEQTYKRWTRGKGRQVLAKGGETGLKRAASREAWEVEK